MADIGEQGITQAVIETVSRAPDARARQVSEALVRHLHAFVREIEPSEAEWQHGIDFLTATGQKCG